MTRIIKAAALEPERIEAGSLNLADFAEQARTIILDARKEAARITAQAKIHADAAQDAGRKQGYEAGFEQGRQAGLEAGRDEALRDIRQDHHAEYHALLDLGREIASGLSQARQEGLRQASEEVLELAILLSERIVHKVAATDDRAAKENLRKALELAELGGKAVVKVHPAQLESLREHCRELAESFGAAGQVLLAADENVGMGGVKVLTAHCSIDATIEAQLTKAAEALLGPRDDRRESYLAGRYEPASHPNASAPKPSENVTTHGSD